jgi:hypothetical protein
MAFEYTELAADVLELITEFASDATTGTIREVTLLQLNAAPTNPAKPWLPGNVRTAPVATKVVPAVFVDPSSLDALGREATRDDSWVARSTQVAIIATTESLEKYNEMVDTDGSRWKVTGVRMLKPGPINLLAYIGVSR